MITDLVFKYIGLYGNNLDSMLLAFGACGDLALHVGYKEIKFATLNFVANSITILK